MATPREDFFILEFNMTLNPQQLAYLAGFLDGDGSIMALIIARDDYRLKYQIQVRVSFFQLKKRGHFLQQIQQELGDQATFRTRNDGMVEVNIVGWRNVYGFLKQSQPYFRIKLKQCNLVMRIIEQLPLTKDNPDKFLELCELVDQVAQLNDSRNRTITAAVVRQRFVDLRLI